MIREASEMLNVPERELRRAIERGKVRRMKWRDVEYLVLRRDWKGWDEGTVVLKKGGEVKLVRGYPHIERLVLLSAIPRIFNGKIAVEEKMDGYNVRAVLLQDQVITLTRGGYICPYTQSRLAEKYGRELKSLLEELPESAVVAGEVVGMENPYVRVPYPEAPTFDYFIFDIYIGENFMPVLKRREIVEKHGLRQVRLIDIIKPNEWRRVKEIIDEFDKEKREGVVLKDLEYEVPPAKYTGSYTNIGNLVDGMQYPFEEGKSFLFSRIIREIFKSYEEGLEGEALERKAKELGMAILAPAINSVKKVARGDALYERFYLVFPSKREYREFLDYMASQGVRLGRDKVYEIEGRVIVWLRKFKNSTNVIKSILERGTSVWD